MYKQFGKSSFIFRNIRFGEDIALEREQGYKFGFDLFLLPTVKIGNSYSSFRIKIVWLSWELIFHRFKKAFY